MVKPQVDLTANKAWLLGFIAGDGCVEAKFGSHYAITICVGTDFYMTMVLAQLFKDIYGITAHVIVRKPTRHSELVTSRNTIYLTKCTRRAVVDDVLSFAQFGVYRWTVPAIVMNGSESIRCAWVRGFSDAEGHVFNRGRSRTVSLTSVNKDGLGQVTEILKGLGVISTTSMHKRSDCRYRDRYTLVIARQESLITYADKIGFVTFSKAGKLDQAVKEIYLWRMLDKV